MKLSSEGTRKWWVDESLSGEDKDELKNITSFLRKKFNK